MTDKEKQDLFWDWFKNHPDIHSDKVVENFRMNGWLLEYQTDIGRLVARNTISHDVREIVMWEMFEPTLRQKEREEKLKELGL